LRAVSFGFSSDVSLIGLVLKIFPRLRVVLVLLFSLGGSVELMGPALVSFGGNATWSIRAE
jgi:hypothetical protein